MDAFGDLFRGVRAQGSLFGSTTLTAPWSLLFVDGAPLTLCTALEGYGWIVPEGRPPEHLVPGDTLIVRGPAPFSFVDEVGTGAVPIECGEDCAIPEQGGTVHRLGWHDGGPVGAPRRGRQRVRVGRVGGARRPVGEPSSTHKCVRSVVSARP